MNHFDQIIDQLVGGRLHMVASWVIHLDTLFHTLSVIMLLLISSHDDLVAVLDEGKKDRW